MAMKRVVVLVLVGILSVGLFGGLALGDQSSSSEIVLRLARASDNGTLGFTTYAWQTSESLQLFYDQLINVDPTQGFALKPGLLISWETEDYKTWIFHVRRDVKFHDGTFLNAEAVKFTLDAIMNDPAAAYAKFAAYGKAVEVIGEYALRMELKEKYPLMMHFLALDPYAANVVSPTAFREHASESDPFATEWLANHECGTGPFILEEWEPGEKLVAKRWKDYWGGGLKGIRETPKVDKIIYLVVPDPSVRMMMLERGDIDIAGGLTTDMYKNLEEKEGIIIHSFPFPKRTFLQYDVTSAPFNDVNVRKAISYAINYKELIEQAEHGYAEKLCGFPPKGLLGASPEFADYYTYDLEKAKQLLEESAYPNGFETGLMYAPDRYIPFKEYALYIQSYLRDIGIKVNIKTVTLNTQLARHEAGNYGLSLQIYMGGGAALGIEPVSWQYNSKRDTGGWGGSHWVSEETEVLTPLAEKTGDSAKRGELIKKIDRAAHEQAIYVYLAQVCNVYAARDNIKELHVTPTYEIWWTQVVKN